MSTTAGEASARSDERRRFDRRQGDRRQGRPRAAPPGDSGHPGHSVHPSPVAAEPALRDTEFSEPSGQDANAGDAGSSGVRIVRVYVAARALVGVSLVAAQLLSSWLGLGVQRLLLGVSLLYALQALLLWRLPVGREVMGRRPAGPTLQRQWLLSIGVDLLAFSALHLVQLESSLNYAALLVLPVMMAGVLGPRVVALATAAGVSLVLLAIGWRASLTAPEGLLLLSQQGLVGIGLFAIALVTAELSARLAREERAAQGSRELARRQAQLNRLVLEEMAEGVLVVDQRLRVRAVNPAARLLLSVDERTGAPPFPLDEQAAWAPLAEAVRQGFAGEPWPEAGRALELRAPGSRPLRLLVRMRFTRRAWEAVPPEDASRPFGEEDPGSRADANPGEDYCVLFIEDMRTVQARVRQDKLAAMGRMSAGIAHEIRNPLAAIAQANELMTEELQSPGQQQLARMVQENVGRLQRIVEDVLEAASGAAPPGPQWVDAREQVLGVVRDWLGTTAPASGRADVVALDLPESPLWVQFDAEHLRRVLVNLLDNALRHGSGEAAAIQVRLAARDRALAALTVASDGDPILPEVERHLFEPFFSTRSRGSGLGLYICRELCERHGALIDFRLRPPRERHRNAFEILMQRQREPGPRQARRP